MLIKNIVGAIIIILNMAGLGFLFYLSVVSRFSHTDTSESSGFNNMSRTGPADRQPVIIDEDIIPDEDDLLKDMDLSDLDSLDLDDFN